MTGNRHLDDAYQSALRILADRGHDAAMVKSGEDLMVVVVKGEAAVNDVQASVEEVMERWDRRMRRKRARELRG